MPTVLQIWADRKTRQGFHSQWLNLSEANFQASPQERKKQSGEQGPIKPFSLNTHKVLQ